MKKRKFDKKSLVEDFVRYSCLNVETFEDFCKEIYLIVEDEEISSELSYSVEDLDNEEFMKLIEEIWNDKEEMMN